MENSEAASSSENPCVYVETSLGNFILPVLKDEITSSFKEKICMELKNKGDVIISALKIEYRGVFYQLSELANVRNAFERHDGKWLMHALIAEEGGKIDVVSQSADVVKIDQEKDHLPLEDGKITSREMVSHQAENKLEICSGPTDPISRGGHVGKENDMGEKKVENMKNEKRKGKEQKKKQRKSSEDHIIQSTAPTTSDSLPHSQGEKPADDLVEAIPNEKEIGGKFVDMVGRKEFPEKKSSKKPNTSTKEDTLVASGAQKVEPINAVDGEGPDNVTKNELDSSQQRNRTEESPEKERKNSSESSKKKHSLNAAENQIVEVNEAAKEDAHPINNPKDTGDHSDASVKDVVNKKKKDERKKSNKNDTEKGSNSTTESNKDINTNNDQAVEKRPNSKESSNSTTRKKSNKNDTEKGSNSTTESNKDINTNNDQAVEKRPNSKESSNSTTRKKKKKREEKNYGSDDCCNCCY